MVPSEFRELQRSQRSRLKSVHCRRSAAQLSIPLAGETLTLQTNRAFDPIFFLSPLSKLLGPIKETLILTWTIHEVGYEELLSLVGSVDLGSVVLKARPNSVKEVKTVLESKGHTVQTTKARAKLILVETLNRMYISINTQPSPDGETHSVSSDLLVWSTLSKVFEDA